MAHKNAFTLVELIVGVTISMLLMTSVGVLVSGGMQNILKQQKIMQKNALLTTSVSDFYNDFDNIAFSGGYINHNNSGALFKINQNIQKGGFGYFGLTSRTGSYCSSDSDIPNFDYLTWKTFIPYEEIGEDIMDNYSEALDQTVLSGATTYRVDTLNHKIYENNGGGDVLIIGGEVFGHEFENGAVGTNVRLNNPTGIVLAEGGFFFSDTLNHRVLFYENGNVSLILDKNDGLSEPTGLAYSSSEKSLYIANSGKGEILKYASQEIIIIPDLEIDFSPNQNVNNITRFILDFSQDISSPTNTGAYSTTNEDYARIENGNYEYYFTDYLNQSSTGNGPLLNCTSQPVTINMVGSQPIKTSYNCTGTHTGSTLTSQASNSVNFNSSQNYQINLQNILPLFSAPGNHLVELELFNNASSEYRETFKYFSQGDGEVKNGLNMTLSVFANNLKYPTGLEINGGNTELIVNDFIERKEYTYTLSNASRGETKNLEVFTSENFAQFEYSYLTDTILNNPVSNISINYDVSAKYFSTNIQYYQFINCYDPDENVEKTLIFSKSLQ